MRNFRRLGALLLTALMIIGTTNTTAFAADVSQNNESNVITKPETVYEFEITPEMVNADGSGIMPMSTIDQSFNMTTSHTGSTRTYYGNTLRYGISVTDANGNAVDNIVAIRLYRSNGSLVSEDQVWCNGIRNVREAPISSGSAYYFKYLLAYGTTRTLKVHMYITSY